MRHISLKYDKTFVLTAFLVSYAIYAAALSVEFQKIFTDDFFKDTYNEVKNEEYVQMLISLNQESILLNFAVAVFIVLVPAYAVAACLWLGFSLIEKGWHLESLLKEPIVHPSEKRYHGRETVHLPRPVPFPSKGVFIVVDCIIPAQIIVEQRQIISPTICCTGSSTSEQTWSRTITNDFTWRKMNWHDTAWAGIIKSFYGENGVINLRAGLEIAY